MPDAPPVMSARVEGRKTDVMVIFVRCDTGVSKGDRMAAELKCYAYLHGGGVSDDVRDVTPRFISEMLEDRDTGKRIY